MRVCVRVGVLISSLGGYMRSLYRVISQETIHTYHGSLRSQLRCSPKTKVSGNTEVHRPVVRTAGKGDPGGGSLG